MDAHDISAAGTIDWGIEGGTYGCYSIVVGNVPTQTPATVSGASLAIQAQSDLDGDGFPGCVNLFKPLLDSTGALVAGTPAACGQTVSVPPFGQANVATSDYVF